MIDTGAFLVTLPVAFGAIVILMVATYICSRIAARHSVIDVTWGLGFALVALVSALVGGGPRDRRFLVLALVGFWGLRLALHIYRRSRGHGEDSRYDAMLAKAPGNRELFAIRKIYLTQAVVLWFVSLPVQLNGSLRGGLTWVSWAGVGVWAVGLGFESVGDWQLQRFRDDSSNKGKVMDRGLWKYTRHPNYFGDATMWWGIFVIVASRWPGVLSFPSILVMTWFLAYGTGKPLLEKQMIRTKPGYADYVKRTSGFFPFPPRRS